MVHLNVLDLLQSVDPLGDPAPSQSVASRILARGHGWQAMLLFLRQGHVTPEHESAGAVLIYTIRGQATFYKGADCSPLIEGTLLRLDPHERHRVEATLDTVLLVSRIDESAQARPLRELDLRLLPRPERHRCVRAAFGSLPVGGAFTLTNDHDPQPLRTELEKEYSEQVDWEYVERGPVLFRITLSRLLPANGAKTAAP